MAHARLHLGKELGEPLGPASLSVFCPEGENASPGICRAQVEAVALSATAVLGQALCSWIGFGGLYLLAGAMAEPQRTSVTALDPCRGGRHRYAVTKADTSIPRCHLF